MEQSKKEKMINNLIEEVARDNNLDSYFNQKVVRDYVEDAIYDIDNAVGYTIDYSNDLKAKALLKNYVKYAIYGRLSEFKELYAGEYATLQIWYNRDSKVS